MSRAALSVLKYAGGSAAGAVLAARAAVDGSEGTAPAHAQGSGLTVPRIPTLSIKRDTSSSSVPLRSLDDEALNQPLGRPQSLGAWSFTQDKVTGHHFVQSKVDPNDRYQAPDGSNWVHGVAHPRRDARAARVGGGRLDPAAAHVVAHHGRVVVGAAGAGRRAPHRGVADLHRLPRRVPALHRGRSCGGAGQQEPAMAPVVVERA